MNAAIGHAFEYGFQTLSERNAAAWTSKERQ
jgi:hypothetical protein